MMTTYDPCDALKMMVSGFLMLAVCIVEALAVVLAYSIQLLWEHKLTVFKVAIIIAFATVFPRLLSLLAFLIV